MPKKENSDSSENQEQYIEIIDPAQQKKIDKKLKEQITKDEGKITSKIPVLIQDDREKINPILIDKTPSHTEKNANKNSQKTQNQNKPTQYKQTKKNQKYQQKDQKKDEKSNALKYKPKQQTNDEKTTKPKLKYQQKAVQKTQTIQCEQNTQLEDLVSKAEKILNKQKSVIIKASGRNIELAFLGAHQLHKKFENLQRINIPGQTVVPHQNEPNKKVHLGTIKLELSLKQLDKNNMGYQQTIVFEKIDQNCNNQNKNEGKNNSLKRGVGSQRDQRRNDREDSDSDRDYR